MELMEYYSKRAYETKETLFVLMYAFFSGNNSKELLDAIHEKMRLMNDMIEHIHTIDIQNACNHGEYDCEHCMLRKTPACLRKGNPCERFTWYNMQKEN